MEELERTLQSCQEQDRKKDKELSELRDTAQFVRELQRELQRTKDSETTLTGDFETERSRLVDENGQLRQALLESKAEKDRVQEELSHKQAHLVQLESRLTDFEEKDSGEEATGLSNDELESFTMIEKQLLDKQRQDHDFIERQKTRIAELDSELLEGHSEIRQRSREKEDLQAAKRELQTERYEQENRIGELEIELEARQQVNTRLSNLLQQSDREATQRVRALEEQISLLETEISTRNAILDLQQSQNRNQGLLLEAYRRKGVTPADDETVSSFIQHIEELNSKLEGLRAQIAAHQADQALLMKEKEETEEKLRGFQEPLKINSDRITGTIMKLGQGAFGG